MADNGVMYRAGDRDDRITIRLPAALKAALEAEAVRDRRSIADIVIPVLEREFMKKKAGK